MVSSKPGLLLAGLALFLVGATAAQAGLVVVAYADVDTLAAAGLTPDAGPVTWPDGWKTLAFGVGLLAILALLSWFLSGRPPGVPTRSG